ncbi:MAG: hypothetical protein R6V13_06370 [Anaerolineae bacterium]
MISTRSKPRDATHAPLVDPTRAPRTSGCLLPIIYHILLFALLVCSPSLITVRADDYPPPPTTPSPAATGDSTYPDPTDTAPSATPPHTDIPLTPSPREQQETDTPQIEKTDPPTRTPSGSTITPSEPTPEKDLTSPERQTAPLEQDVSGEIEPASTSEKGDIKALPTIVGPSPAASPVQAQEPLIPQELFTCSVALLVLVTIVLGLHLARSEQDRS